MSIQKSDEGRQVNFEKETLREKTNLEAVVSSVSSTKVHILTPGGSDSTDLTKLWSGTIASPVGIRKKHLVFKNIEYIITDWSGDDFPNVIYLLCDGINGYYDETVTVTKRVAALQLTDVEAVMDQSQVRTYQLRYILRDPQTWEVPITQTSFVFRLCIDTSSTQSPITLPLPNPIALNFEVRTE